MKYVILGSLNAGAIGTGTRVRRAKKKLSDLGIKLDAIYYTQGEYDFVDVMEAPNPEAMLAFSVWYAKQGYGQLRSMPAFDEAAMDKAVSGKAKPARSARTARRTAKPARRARK